MAACAGVQKVSRPIERCQEMSQMMPTFALVAATSVAATYQGRCAASGGAPVAGAAAAAIGLLLTRAAGGPSSPAATPAAPPYLLVRVVQPWSRGLGAPRRGGGPGGDAVR